MDFSYSEDQLAAAGLARQILRDRVTDEYHLQAPSLPDSELWKTLAGAGLLGVAPGEACGGSGLGFIAACLVLREAGGVLAPVPLLSTLVAGLCLDEWQEPESASRLTAGETWCAVSTDSGLALEGGHVTGELTSVPFAEGAGLLLAVVGEQVVLVDMAQPGISLEAQQQTSGLPASHIVLDTGCRLVGGDNAAGRLRQCLQVATAMQQLGVLEEALARTAAFTIERAQFGQPLARFQAVSQRAADGYIDIEALRATAEGAMWRLHEGLDAALEAAAALWWTAEAGHRIGHTAQHLHGGLGADLSYPIHRFFLWAKQQEFGLGGAAHTAAAMGQHLAWADNSGERK